MKRVRPKKSLGQHFLKDKTIAARIAASLAGTGYDSVLEIGPGKGILTGFLMQRNFADFRVIEIDHESVDYLHESFPEFQNILTGDFLAMDIDRYFSGKVALAGNFPYNISSQILFKALAHRNRVAEITGMFQKEVAERICASSGSRVYGILSVLVQAFYNAEYLFTVDENVFEPPPKVKSAVIRLSRNGVEHLGCNEQLFFRVVKTCFSQRRKMLRNSVKSAFSLKDYDLPVLSMRPEQLTVAGFVDLTNWIAGNMQLSE
ncbi:MAG: 16S rRNA (adenine(1518)-N(6)/adenine(1519)-N(6))-dimethyltransferase RsmA [Bacteroidales bacterium]|jgi:16S rRNA (adenine1518-N6/adenine1519-N6)-dimethyltransferase|nr:16S rRNA (adenine(1518)-N(6)/adenine(1519)-N(6))-dimethyltransferase RsmA [Bacteroidales bacterium]